MNNYLSNIPTIIEQVDKEYHVIYTIQEDTMTIVGGCNYKEWEQRSKYQTEPVYLLTQVYMFEIIDYINEKSPLSEWDYQDINMEIRNHSLQYVTEFINEIGHHQPSIPSTIS